MHVRHAPRGSAQWSMEALGISLGQCIDNPSASAFGSGNGIGGGAPAEGGQPQPKPKAKPKPGKSGGEDDVGAGKWCDLCEQMTTFWGARKTKYCSECMRHCEAADRRARDQKQGQYMREVKADIAMYRLFIQRFKESAGPAKGSGCRRGGPSNELLIIFLVHDHVVSLANIIMLSSGRILVTSQPQGSSLQPALSLSTPNQILSLSVLVLPVCSLWS